MRLFPIAIAALLAGGPILANPAQTSPAARPIVEVAPAAIPAAAMVDAFHASLRRGDTRTALSYLAEEALIFEGGRVERGKREYAAHHLGSDAEFAKAVPSVLLRRSGTAVGNWAWIASEGRTSGSYRGKAVDRVTTETMVLRRANRGWRIVHIHWSSAAALGS